MVKTFSFVLALFLLGCACTQKISYNSPKSLKEVANSVVKIGITYETKNKIILSTIKKSFLATGFSFFTTDVVSYVLTNQHVCDMGAKAEYILTLKNGQKIKATFIRVDPFADICLLRANGFIQPLKLNKANAAQGERVSVVGSPDGVFPIFIDGIVSGYHNMNMKKEEDDDGQFEIHFRSQVVSVPIYQGASGSPVLNENGKVVGIVFAIRSGKEHISFIVPISEVLRFLDTDEYVDVN